MFEKTIKIMFVIFFTLLTFSFANLFGQTKLNTAKLDSLITTLDLNKRAMFSVSIAEKGNVIYHRSIGFIDSNVTVQPNEHTRYRIGSISKMFTSVMILQLVEEKKLTLETKLAKFFPKVKNASKITITDLLSHQSGIHNFTNDSLYFTYYTSFKSQKEMVDIINALSSDFEPTTKQEYSNSNFVLLGFIIEKLTKKSYALNLQERIVAKIGLKNTYYGANANLNKNETRSFKWLNDHWNADKETDMSIPHGAGAIVSTTDDLVKFSHALFSGKFISQASIDNMITLRHDLGLGIFPSTFKGKKGFGHNGGIDEFKSQLKYFTEDSLSVAITCNGARYSMSDCMKGVLSCYYNESYTIPSFVTHQVTEAIIKPYVGTYHSSQLNMGLIVTNVGASLIAEPEGQEAVALEPTSDSTFVFMEAAAVFEFKKAEDGSVNEVILQQGGRTFSFSRK